MYLDAFIISGNVVRVRREIYHDIKLLLFAYHVLCHQTAVYYMTKHFKRNARYAIPSHDFKFVNLYFYWADPLQYAWKVLLFTRSLIK